MPRRSRLFNWHHVAGALVVTDLIAISVALAGALLLRFDVPYLGSLEPRTTTISLGVVPFLTALWLVAFAMAGLYQERNLIGGLAEYQRILIASGAVLLLVIVATYLRTAYVSRGFLVVAFGPAILLVWLERFLGRQLLHKMALRGRFLHLALVVGTGRQAVAVARQLQHDFSSMTEVIGFLSDYQPLGTSIVGGLKVVGEPLQLAAVAAELHADCVVVIESDLSWESLRSIVRIMHRRDGVQVRLVPGLFDLHATPMHPQLMGSLLTLSPERTRLIGMEAAIKRIFDLVFASLGIVIAAPILASIWAMSVTTRQPFRRDVRRYFAAGRELELSQFSHPEWMRGRHLARLPELLQVFAGRLSLIGPRPVAVERAQEYGQAFELLSAIKPGFIGPWWLVGRSRPPTLPEELEYDLFYVRHYSIWIDMAVLFQGLLSLARRKAPRSVGSPGNVLGRFERTRW